MSTGQKNNWQWISHIVAVIAVIGAIISTTLFISERPTRDEVETKLREQRQDVVKSIGEINTKLDRLIDKMIPQK